MKLLLDTHVLIWWLLDEVDALEPFAEAIEDEANEALISAASIWEIGTKRAKGRLEVPEDLVDAVESTGFTELPVTIRHAAVATSLPPHHNDPFDRLLVAQTQIEGLTLASVDPMMPRYGIPVLGR